MKSALSSAPAGWAKFTWQKTLLTSDSREVAGIAWTADARDRFPHLNGAAVMACGASRSTVVHRKLCPERATTRNNRRSLARAITLPTFSTDQTRTSDGRLGPTPKIRRYFWTLVQRAAVTFTLSAPKETHR